jgi:hypothetical protein
MAVAKSAAENACVTRTWRIKLISFLDYERRSNTWWAVQLLATDIKDDHIAGYCHF